jgi:hypothetical protein
VPQPVPAVPGIPAGWKPVQADVDFWVTDSFSFVAQPACFRAQLLAALALAGGSFTLLPFDTVLEDPYGGWSAVATGSQPAYSWLCPAGCAGWYEASVSAFSTATTTQLAAALYLNGSAWAYPGDDWAVSGAGSGTNGPVQVPLLAGDYVQVYAYAGAAASTPATAAQYPAVELAWISS